ncbi:hypothetical protein D3W54_01305 [Komagataeibacter medellinensis]|uniref:Lipoprotein n=1 Tax=Komagataeibacter medellinensis TaxID=1177712 RepID=A0ABQ6VSB2_9PROT|nr:hypothetical protein [Komagataeibacter medellinensis]KAB8123084.1 hypothetical protein D3W54_01305 [Komagataeibacter medellinensis]
MTDHERHYPRLSDLLPNALACPQDPRPPRGPRLGGAILALAVSAMVALALAGCAHPAMRPVCIPLKAYSATDEKALEAELKAHADMPLTHDVARDWLRMRDEDRVCLKKAGGRE